jgi:osmotically-inducible protein OsmY
VAEFPSETASPAQHPSEAKAEAALRASPYVPLHHVVCHWQDGVLTIQGRVPSFYLKQLAQTMAGSVDGIDSVDNRLDVVPMVIGL